MTEPLHDLLTRIADQAGPTNADPTLWDRARRARRDRRRRRAVALVAAGLAAVSALTAVGIQADRHEPPQPVEQPDRKTSGPGIPSVVYGVPGDGGLDLETDLAVGQASVAIANPVGVYVVTAQDGVYHRVRLPGYDAGSYDAGLPGIALSPDGTRLAYGWQSTALRPDGYPQRSGLRVLDLTTGTRWSTLFHLPSGSSDLNVFAWDLRWSPDGRHLGASVAIHEVGGAEHWYALVANEASGGRVVREMWNSTQWPDPPQPIMVSAAGRAAAVATDPRDRLVTWRGDHWRTLASDVEGLSTGRFSPDGRWLALTTGGLGTEITLVRADEAGSDAAPHVAALPERRYPYGASVDLLSWTGESRLLSLVWAGTGPTTVGPDADLAFLTTDLGPRTDGQPAGDDEVAVDVVGRVAVGGTRSVFSFATDLVTPATPVRDREPPPFVDQPLTPPGQAAEVAPSASSQDGDGPSVALSTLLLSIAGAVVLAALLLAASRTRRQRPAGARHG